MSATTRPLYRVLADQLHALGTTRCFGVMGEDTAALTVAAIERGIRYLGTRHEAAAVGMADGFSWASGGLGVCMVTRGPGLMNAATACRTAVRGRRRLLLITGDAPTGREPIFDNKFVEQGPIAAALGMSFFTASAPGKAIDVFASAVGSAREGRPAVLAIPADVFHADVVDLSGPPGEPAASALPAPPAAGELAELTGTIDGARRPLILAGRGATGADTANALRRLADRIGALLGTTLLAKDLFRGHALDLGVVGSFASDPAAGLLAEVDCVLAFGASLTPFTTGQRTLFAEAKVIQIDSDPAALGANFPIALGVLADARLTAERLLESLGPDERTDGPDEQADSRRFDTAETLARLRRPLYDGPDESAPGELDPRIVASTLDRLLPAARSVVLDSGRFMTSPARFVRVQGPGYFRLTADAGSIAVGLGIALGAAVARPELANVLFIGDGGLSMSLGDLETAVRHSVGLIVVVMNDRAYGAEWVQLQADGLPTRYAALPQIDFAPVARALGIEAATVASIAELEALAPLLTGRSRPLLIDCRIRQDLTAARLQWQQSDNLLGASSRKGVTSAAKR